jgi:NAD(P)-dependent dehydrogenase (short-subunit alcohol dehydrogenase family)
VGQLVAIEVGAVRHRPVNSVAIVTGASSGIGAATARLIASRGIRVLATGRDQDRLAKVAAAEEDIVPLPCDLSTPEGPKKLIDEAARVGPPLIVVHSAGIGGYLDRAIWDMSPAAWRRTLSVNLDAAFLLLHMVAPYMRDVGWGRYVAVGSTAGSVGAPAMSAYSASKAGLLGLVRSAAQDLAPYGATVNAVLPGWVRGTAMAEADAREEAKRRGVTVRQVWAERTATYPAGRLLQPDDVAKVIAFLASDEAAAVSGEALTVAIGSSW